MSEITANPSEEYLQIFFAKVSTPYIPLGVTIIDSSQALP